MDTKVCSRCGRELPLSEYRPYYGGRRGYYRHCKTCESIEMRKRYLDKKAASGSLTDKEQAQYDKIVELYKHQEAAGLSIPQAGTAKTRYEETDSALDMLMNAVCSK